LTFVVVVESYCSHKGSTRFLPTGDLVD